MHDPKPVQALLIVQILGLVGVLGWWAWQPPGARLVRLTRIMVEERGDTAPPTALDAQATWLLWHRAQRLQGLVGLGVLALVVGVGEGLARRRRDVLGGFLLRWWTTGVLTLTCVPGLLAGYALAPWPLTGWYAAGGMAATLALAGYGCASGRPFIS